MQRFDTHAAIRVATGKLTRQLRRPQFIDVRRTSGTRSHYYEDSNNTSPDRRVIPGLPVLRPQFGPSSVVSVIAPSWLFCQECHDLLSYDRPGSGKRAGNLKVAHIRNTYQSHWITCLFRRKRISLTQRNGSDVIVPSPDKNLRYPKGQRFYCRHLSIAFGKVKQISERILERQEPFRPAGNPTMTPSQWL